MDISSTAPSREYLEFNFVGETATGRGNNTQFIMENLGNGTFMVTEGRVGIKVGRYKPRSYVRPINEWDAMYQSKLHRGYLLTKTVKLQAKEITRNAMSVNGNHFKPLSDLEVNTIISRLLAFANQVMECNYTVKVEDISDEMISYGKDILEVLATGFEQMSVAEFNNKLKTLYAAIPRRIDNLSKTLAKRKADFNDIVANEQDLYDIMIGQIRNHNIEKCSDLTILDSYGLDWRTVTPDEADMIKKKLGSEESRYVNAWRIVNRKTEDNFNEYCRKENLSDDNGGISHLFHGSRNENFWSIVTNGLTINPTGVVITGKAYGNGTYFAPAAVKSMGYTSRCGSRWANGSSKTGFLGIYKVATGKRYNGSGGCNHTLNYKKLQEICPGAHCTWAEARYSGFMMDEVIVYQDQQSTVEYLVEVGL